MLFTILWFSKMNYTIRKYKKLKWQETSCWQRSGQESSEWWYWKINRHMNRVLTSNLNTTCAQLDDYNKSDKNTMHHRYGHLPQWKNLFDPNLPFIKVSNSCVRFVRIFWTAYGEHWIRVNFLWREIKLITASWMWGPSSPDV